MNLGIGYGDGFFYIENHDNFRWYNLEFKLNYIDSNSGYDYYLSSLNRDKLIGIMDFKNEEGSRFNPWEEEPTILSIYAETEDGRTGNYIKEW